MKRFGILGLSAVLAMAAASVSDNTFAQQKVTKDQLVGNWTFVTCTRADGSIPAGCVNRDGRMMLDATGQYMSASGPRGRSKCTGACGAQQMSADQYKSATLGFFSNFGNWSFDDAYQTLTLTREAALFPNNEGRVSKDNVSLIGDELRLKVIVSGGAGAGVGGTAIYRRVR